MNAPQRFCPTGLWGTPRGDRIVRLVYIDEAGISGPPKEPFTVVAAVIVDADKKLVSIKRHLDRIIARHIPEEHRTGFIFHATELFNGGGKVFLREPEGTANPKWPLRKRLEIADELAAIPGKFDLPIAIGFVKWDEYPHDETARAEFQKATKSERLIFAHVTAFMSCALMIDHWMRRKTKNEVCLMVVEDNEQARKLIRDTVTHHQDRRLIDTIPEGQRLHFPLRTIMEEPLFQKKQPGSVLQIADFCAYVLKRSLMGDPHYQPRFSNPLWKKVDEVVQTSAQARDARRKHA